VKETLRALAELQNLEDNLRDLRVFRSELVALTGQNEETRHIFQGMLAEREAQLAEVAAFCDEKESGIKESEENARRARGRLNHIQSQRELTALNKELDTARRQNQQRSEELLKLMEQLEAATADYKKKKEEFAALDQQMNEAEEDLVRKVREGEADAGDQRERQAALREGVDKPTLARFDRILKGRDGYAVANVVDNICHGCRVSVSPQIFIRLMRMETLESCHNCRRLLVWKDGLYPQAVAEPESVEGEPAEA
jgi:hypothetical protein